MEEQISLNAPLQVNIESEMENAYLDYAMSVIVGRALPDVRDGLKPVHRRILYAMYDLNNYYNKAYKKSARVVGDVVGKYHPHGDTAVYDTLVRMAQDFSLRYPLVDGQGNFGSVDGDSAAAMRYTEVRMNKITSDLLADLESDTVNFTPNYDGSLKEPLVFPSRIPNLLVNGSSGIAVAGMATNIPPHNLTEIVSGCIATIDNPEITIDELYKKHIKGPDFPTAAYLYGKQGILDAYKTGRGSIRMRAKVEIEVKKNDREAIVINELPYQVNKAHLVENIADLVRNKKIEGISDIRDESDRDGIRVVIDIKRDQASNIILNKLFKFTQLEKSFGIIMLALDHNSPRVLSLKAMLTAFIDHRKEVVIRRCLFELKKAERKVHLLEGLKIALDNIDNVIALIKKAKNVEDARHGLMTKFKLTDIQAQAILEMRLQKLTNLERDNILKDYKETKKLIERLKFILGDEKEIFRIIREELEEVKDKYGDVRRTQFIAERENVVIEDLIPDEDVVVTITNTGYIKRSTLNSYRTQSRGGKGVRGIETRDQDFVSNLFVASTLDYLLCFSNLGRLYWLKVYNIPEASRSAKGKAIVNMLRLSPREKIQSILPVKEFKEDKFVTMITKNGIIKKTDLMQFSNPRASGIIALTIDEADELVTAGLTEGDCDVFISTMYGQSIRFPETDVRSMGRSARGVRGITLSENDCVIGMVVLKGETTILVVSERGFGKRTLVGEYRIQSRGGSGIMTMRASERNGNLIGIKKISDKEQLMLITNMGQVIRIKVSDISLIGRVTQGVRLITLKSGERLVSIAPVREELEKE